MASTLHIHIRGVRKKDSATKKQYIVEYYHGSSLSDIDFGTHMEIGIAESVATAMKMVKSFVKNHKKDHPVVLAIHNCGSKDGKFRFINGRFYG
jgi:hypothetical protein